MTELPFLGCFPLVPAFLCSVKDHLLLRSVQGQALWPGLDSIPKWLRQKWLLLCQESHAWFSFSRDPLTYQLIVTSAGGRGQAKPSLRDGEPGVEASPRSTQCTNSRKRHIRLVAEPLSLSLSFPVRSPPFSDGLIPSPRWNSVQARV